MIKSIATFLDFIIAVPLLSFLILLQIPASGQVFVDEGIERGVDAIITAQGFSAPGVSSIDFDQDGDDDLSIGSDGNVLFYQNNDGEFQLIDLGIESPFGELQSVMWTDINNDGNLDLFLSSYFSDFRLYKNTGDMEFEDITETCGISTDVAANLGVSFSDINRDGYVDVQLCRYQVEADIPDSPSIQPELWTRLYLNNGDETFTDYTIEGGLVIDPAPAFLGVFLDFNNDLWPDNYTIIDRAPGNRLFVNCEGSFTDVTEEHGVSYSENDIMSNTVADYNNDGYLDVFMTNDAVSTFLLKNNQGQSFNNVAPSAGVDIDVFAWGAIWIDADNDGWQDLFFGTPSYEANYFFLNDQGNFTQQGFAMQLDEEVPSFSASKGDFDNDGFYDMIIQSKAPDRSPLLMNQGNENKFIKVTPHGTVSNTMAIGSWVKVFANENEYVHFTLSGEGYISQNSQHLIFGLGAESSQVDSVTIWYPSGHSDSYFNLAVDSSYHFYEGETFQFNIASENTQVCLGDQVLLDAGEHESYLWNTGETTRFIEVDTTGNYSVAVTNQYGISASNGLDVDFHPYPIIAEAISPNACRGDSTATISLENLLDNAADSVIWQNGMTGEMIGSLFAGDYTYVFTDVNGCASSGTTSVIDPTELLVFANGNPADVGQSNGSVAVTIFGGVSPYFIIFEGDTVGSSISNLAAGEYTISVTDTYGCTVTVDVTVDSTLGAARNKLSDTISIYPNPTRGRVEIKSESKIARIFIYGSTSILEKEVALSGNSINLENLASGLYLLKVELINTDVSYFRIVKE
jgi:hypothetical protein